MLKSLATDLSGAADVCHFVHNLSECLAAAFLLPGETLLFSFQSAKEEFSFTSQALLTVKGESATTTRKLVERHMFKHEVVRDVKFETAGNVDRDCEIKFVIGSEHVSIDIAKAEMADARDYYKVLTLLARAQASNERTWDLAKLALERSSDALYLSENSGQTLPRQSDETLAWLSDLYARTHPESYREVIEGALQELRTQGKSEVNP
jgi:hypothetical protein